MDNILNTPIDKNMTINISIKKEKITLLQQIDIRTNSRQRVVVLHPDPNLLVHRQLSRFSNGGEDGRAD